MDVKQKISSLVNKGYKEAAFRNKSNYDRFKDKWKEKGYSTHMIKSSGPVVEGGYKDKAYYAIATKTTVKKKTTRPRDALHSAFNPYGKNPFW